MFSLIAFYSLLTLSAQDFSPLPGGLRSSCKHWNQQKEKLNDLPDSSAAQGCVDQINASIQTCRNFEGPRDKELSQLVVSAGAKGAARAQSQAYAKAERDSASQAETCGDEYDKLKEVCNQTYNGLQAAVRENSSSLQSIQRELKTAPEQNRARLLARIQEYRRVDNELSKALNDTRTAKELGSQIMNDLISCHNANARIRLTPQSSTG